MENNIINQIISDKPNIVKTLRKNDYNFLVETGGDGIEVVMCDTDDLLKRALKNIVVNHQIDIRGLQFKDSSERLFYKNALTGDKKVTFAKFTRFMEIAELDIVITGQER